MTNNGSFMQYKSEQIEDRKPVDTKVFLERAARYCAGAEHCAADVAQLLERLGAPGVQIDEVIGILKEQKYIDEQRYCRAFVHDKVAFQGWGRMKIVMGLRAKRLPEAAIQEALEDVDEKIYASNMRKAMHSKRGQDRQKVMRFMLQRGYTFDDLRRYVNMDAEEE